jgi:hypothetical protein
MVQDKTLRDNKPFIFKGLLWFESEGFLSCLQNACNQIR